MCAIPSWSRDRRSQRVRADFVDLAGAAYALVTAAHVGLPIVAYGHIAGLALWLIRRGRWLQRALAPVARIALTGYLGSNLIGSFVWYGWGLGLMGVWNGAAMNLFAFAVFAGLAVFSALWLAVFRFASWSGSGAASAMGGCSRSSAPAGGLECRRWRRECAILRRSAAL
jgi:hypothetical protein